ncbi:hypothetical protein N9C70_02355 [Flavobacteriales bacterium]|nr:hypothetical protein [Flavobacteriales bacterium]MDA9863890.1 hypothetical protein [Flavobacteriales bacterium]
MKGQEWALIVTAAAMLSGCTYDNLESLGSPLDCETLDVSFGTTILPLVSDHCQGCHSGAAPSAGVGFEGHAEIASNAENMLDRMGRAPGDNLLMPQSGKLDSCSIALFSAWINAGKPNN